jgi:hypothetical protein
MTRKRFPTGSCFISLPLELRSDMATVNRTNSAGAGVQGSSEDGAAGVAIDTALGSTEAEVNGERNDEESEGLRRSASVAIHMVHSATQKVAATAMALDRLDSLRGRWRSFHFW